MFRHETRGYALFGYNCPVDVSPQQPSLADDPAFVAGLDALDRGLLNDSLPSDPPPAPPPPSPPRLSRSHPVVPAIRSNVADLPIVIQPDSGRPLLDLFPLSLTSPAVEHGPSPSRAPVPTPRAAPPLTPARSPDRSRSREPFAARAFGADPALRVLYRSVEHARAAQQVLDALGRRDGVIVVTGAAGVGKTMLCRAVADQLGPRTTTSMVEQPPASLDELLEALLVDFGAESAAGGRLARTKGDARARFQRWLESARSRPGPVVVLMDGAHQGTRELLAAIVALVTESSGALQVVLFGREALATTLAAPALQSVAERLASRVELGPLAADEVPDYVRHRLHSATPTPRVAFDDRALTRVFETSRGVPRVVNQVCGRAVTRALETSIALVDAPAVDAAAADLGLAPVRQARTGRRHLAALFLLLAVAGASASAWLFRDRVHEILVHYGYTDRG